MSLLSLGKVTFFGILFDNELQSKKIGHSLEKSKVKIILSLLNVNHDICWAFDVYGFGIFLVSGVPSIERSIFL